MSPSASPFWRSTSRDTRPLYVPRVHHGDPSRTNAAPKRVMRSNTPHEGDRTRGRSSSVSSRMRASTSALPRPQTSLRESRVSQQTLRLFPLHRALLLITRLFSSSDFLLWRHAAHLQPPQRRKCRRAALVAPELPRRLPPPRLARELKGKHGAPRCRRVRKVQKGD